MLREDADRLTLLTPARSPGFSSGTIPLGLRDVSLGGGVLSWRTECPGRDVGPQLYIGFGRNIPLNSGSVR